MPEIIGICDSEYSLEWLIVLFIYKGLILSVGLLLAFEIRKVKIVSLNESRFIGMSVYGAVIVSIALTPIGFSLEDSPTTQYAILGIMMLASVTIILVLIFVTKVRISNYLDSYPYISYIHSVMSPYPLCYVHTYTDVQGVS